MGENYRTVDNDRLDLICYKHYGHLDGAVEKVLVDNPHIANLKMIFNAGVIITLPSLEPKLKVKKPKGKLWQ